MGNERVSKQNGVEALCGDCNTLKEIGRHIGRYYYCYCYYYYYYYYLLLLFNVIYVKFNL